MSWQSARASAALLAERLKLLDSARANGGMVERRKKPRDADDGEPQPQPAMFVKPSRKLEPPPPPVADVLTQELADAGLIEVETETNAPDPEPSAEEDTPEARRAPRKQQALPALVTSPEIANAVPARVIDMSATGAKVELTPMGRATGVPLTDLPGRFLLVLRHDRMEVDCELVWRDGWMLGVRFLGFPRPSQVARR
ncbi:MAG: PilZ domain-containing protein [Hyphomicrobiaceae bacterium]|nr:PilZ domain-containing protein [Hyphomicrobiaceae bacterium]